MRHFYNLKRLAIYVCTNGYRYYSVVQVFQVIKLLKNLGMPLKEIKAYLDSRSPENLIEVLKVKEVEIDNKINQLQSIKDIVRDKINLTQKSLDL